MDAPPAHRQADPVERIVDAAPGIRLWAEYIPAAGPAPREPILLVMGANASGVAWPDALVERLAEHHPVIRYDHRDTGRSTWTTLDDPDAAEDPPPYGVTDLAADAVGVLDAFDVPRAHIVGMSLGGLLCQLLLLDHPERVVTATLFCTGPLGTAGPNAVELPGPSEALLRLWAELGDPRDAASELAWRIEHWRVLNGTGTPFDAAEFQALEERIIAHTGHADAPTAHARMSVAGLDRGDELAGVEVPVLVVEAPEDPAFPPPNHGTLARVLGHGRLVRIPGMGHAINRTVIPPLAAAILTQTQSAPARA